LNYLPLQKYRAPGKSAAYAFEHHMIAAFDTAITHRDVEG
jgi:hypothetical protein